MRGSGRVRLGIAALAALFVLALPGTAAAQTPRNVNTTVDSFDNQTCDPAPGLCTLREAIEFAPAGAVVNVPAGTYTLTEGELVFLTDMTVTGVGARQTVISGGGNSKVAYLAGAAVTMSGVTLTGGNGDGVIPGAGGAVYVASDSTLALANSSVTGNSVTGVSVPGNGGGIYTVGRLFMTGSTVSGNQATGSGGGIYQTGNELQVIIGASTVSGNTATDTGGGIYSAGVLSVLRSTIAGNSARSGGGIYNAFGPVGITDTIVTAGSTGGACGNVQSVTSSYNISTDATCLFTGTGDRQNVNPLLGPLQNNGGQTNTHALLAGSPAIGTANPDPAQCTGTDQRGITRPQQGTCDIGAFEYVPPPPPPPPQPGPPPPQEEKQLPAPVAGERVNLLPKSGRVRIKLRGTKKFVRLREGQQVPVGTIVDTRKGRVTLVAAADKTGKTATSVFWDGIFKIGQTKGRRPITTLKLTEKLSCGSGGKKASTAKKKRKKGKRKRRLWGNGKGRFRTRGKYSAATVRGTKWLVEDRCTRTLTRVRRGRVSVRDFVKKKKVIVRAGKRYVARKAT